MNFIDYNLISGVRVYPSIRTIDFRGSFTHFVPRYTNNESVVPSLEEVAISENKLAGTLRGIHIQKEPFAQEKLIRCISGSIFDIFLDLRSNSNSYMKWSSMRLKSEDDFSLYLPKGIAHGYQTLVDDTTLLYGFKSKFHLGADIHIDPHDTFLGIDWPLPISAISDADMNGISVAQVLRTTNW